MTFLKMGCIMTCITYLRKQRISYRRNEISGLISSVQMNYVYGMLI